MQQIKPNLISELIEKVLNRIEDRLAISDTKQLTTQEYIELHSIFQEDILIKALNIIDTQSITCYQQAENPTDELYEICSTWPSQSIIKLFPNINYCHCAFFKDEILNAQSEPSYYTCEHVLAVRLAKILNKHTIEILPKHKFSFILKQIANQD